MTVLDSIDARIRAGEVIIIDGGTGTEIPRRGAPLCPQTWSGRANLEYPDLIREIHEDYIRSGAEVIATNTFWTSRTGLKMGNLDDKTLEINQLSVRLAIEARSNVKSDKDILIAGSMSTFFPMGNPKVIPEYEDALASYREQAQILAESGVDFFALEMFVRTLDARAAVQAAGEIGLAGELRSIPGADRRIFEAARLGFENCLIPSAVGDTGSNNTVKVCRPSNVLEAVRFALKASSIGVKPEIKVEIPSG